MNFLATEPKYKSGGKFSDSGITHGHSPIVNTPYEMQSVVEAVRVAERRGQRVMTSIGGANEGLNWIPLADEGHSGEIGPLTQSLIDFVVDTKMSGLDLDYEKHRLYGRDPDQAIYEFIGSTMALKRALDEAEKIDGKPRALTMAGWSTGADCSANTVAAGIPSSACATWSFPVESNEDVGPAEPVIYDQAKIDELVAAKKEANDAADWAEDTRLFIELAENAINTKANGESIFDQNWIPKYGLTEEQGQAVLDNYLKWAEAMVDTGNHGSWSEGTSDLVNSIVNTMKEYGVQDSSDWTWSLKPMDQWPQDPTVEQPSEPTSEPIDAQPYQLSLWGGGAGLHRHAFYAMENTYNMPVQDYFETVAIMSYDASYLAYDPVVAYEQYRDILPSSVRVAVGLLPQPEGWQNGQVLVGANADASVCARGTYLERNQYGKFLMQPYSIERIMGAVADNNAVTGGQDGAMIWTAQTREGLGVVNLPAYAAGPQDVVEWAGKLLRPDGAVDARQVSFFQEMNSGGKTRDYDCDDPDFMPTEEDLAPYVWMPTEEDKPPYDGITEEGKRTVPHWYKN